MARVTQKPRRHSSGSRSPRRDIASEITEALIARLESGETLPWRRPWVSSVTALPLRCCGTPYRGINHLMLSILGASSGYASPYWMTFAEAKAWGASVRKGEKASHIIYYGSAKKQGASDQEVDVVSPGAEGLPPDQDVYRFLKSYAVFSANQIDGLPEQFHPEADPVDTGARRIAALDAFFDRLPFPIRTGFGYAAYDEARDEIVMPEISRFETAERFYSVCAHEAAHGSGVKNRLDRRCFADYHKSPEARAEEELRVEISAAFLGAHLGLPAWHLDDHAAYLQSWLKSLRAEPKYLLRVAAEAQRACDWLLIAGGRGSAAPVASAA